MKSLLAAAALAALTVAPAYADCAYPKPPANLPDGSVATLAQMLAAQKKVQAYNHDMTAYLACIKKQSDATIAHQAMKLTPKQIKALEKMEIQRNNAAVDQLQSVANRFNTQVQIYQKKHSKQSN